MEVPRSVMIFLGLSILVVYFSAVCIMNDLFFNYILYSTASNAIKAIFTIEWIVVGVLWIGADPLLKLLMKFPKQDEV